MCLICRIKKEKEMPIQLGDYNVTICQDCLFSMGYALGVDKYSPYNAVNEYQKGKRRTKAAKENKGLLPPKEIKDLLDKHVVGQDNAKKVIAVAIYNHYKRILNGRTDIQKSNIMLVGPTGVGKTEIARTIAKILDVPFAIADATSVTEAGYVGDDVENIVLRLIEAADGDIEKAQTGIIYIDEIDKIARKSENASITRDVSGEGVQQALLKIVEGATITVPVKGGRKHPMGDNVPIDTSNILFIAGGAFESITMNKNPKKNLIGFGDSDTSFNKEESTKIDAKKITKAGIIPELAGRFPIIVELNKLTQNDLKRILIEPDNSIINQYKNLMELDNIQLEFTDNALDLIAKQAYDNETGARGLKSIIENCTLDIMYEAPSDKEIESIIIDDVNNELKTTINKKRA